MKIQYCSDLHLEFPTNREYLRINPLVPKGDILLLAGDIVLLATLDKHSYFFDYVSDHFESVYWVPGNHEYYNFDIANKSGVVNEKIRSNVFLVNNHVVKLKEVKLVFSTMWSHISPANYWILKRSLSDFLLIKQNGSPFTPDHFNKLHKESMDFLKLNLAEKEDVKTIVITHHVPTLLHYPSHFMGDALSEGFVVELHDFILNSNSDYWIYGHHHTNTKDFEIGNTTLLTNQLGYVQHREHYAFRNNAIIEI